MNATPIINASYFMRNRIRTMLMNRRDSNENMIDNDITACTNISQAGKYINKLIIIIIEIL